MPFHWIEHKPFLKKKENHNSNLKAILWVTRHYHHWLRHSNEFVCKYFLDRFWIQETKFFGTPSNKTVKFKYMLHNYYQLFYLLIPKFPCKNLRDIKDYEAEKSEWIPAIINLCECTFSDIRFDRNSKTNYKNPFRMHFLKTSRTSFVHLKEEIIFVFCFFNLKFVCKDILA